MLKLKNLVIDAQKSAKIEGTCSVPEAFNEKAASVTFKTSPDNKQGGLANPINPKLNSNLRCKHLDKHSWPPICVLTENVCPLERVVNEINKAFVGVSNVLSNLNR